MDGDDILEIQFRLKGNSEGLVLQAKSLLNDNWVDRFGIEQDKGSYRLKLGNDEILVLKRYDYLSQKERIVARSANQDIIFYEKKQVDHLWEPSYWKEFFLYHQNEYTMKRVGSGTKGDILPVLKNGQPIAVFAVGNLSVAGKRQFSLYTEHSEEVDVLLLFYIINYIEGLDFLDIDSLMVNYRVFYQFSGRSALTREHLNMLPESRRPSTREGILWVSFAVILVVVIGFISLKPIMLSLGSMIAFYVYHTIKNWREKNG